MKQKFISQTVFLGKSLLWSVLLYTVVMAAINWEELSHRKKQDSRSYVQQETGKELIPIKASAQDETVQIRTSVIHVLKDGIGYIKTIGHIIF
jgi:hypothetical protein